MTDANETDTEVEEEEEEQQLTIYNVLPVEEEIEEEEEEEEDLLNKNTDSFRCLVQLIVSHSSIFRDPYYVFPPLKDPELDKAINYVPPDPIVDDVGAEEYKRMCKEFGIVPISRIIRSLPTNVLDLKYYGLTHKQIVALMAGMQTNKYVQELTLQDNWLSPDSVQYLTKALEINDTIIYLNLRECRIGPEGAAYLAEGIPYCHSLKYLDLAFNSLGDEGLIALSEALVDTNSIIQLDLSHNMLGDGAGEIFENIFKFNLSIMDLNLAWNNFYTGASMKGLVNGLLENKILQSLNLAWNAISSVDCTKHLAKYVKKSQSLQFLDLNSNRLTGPPLKKIRIALRRSKSLLAAKLGNNPINPDDAVTLGKALADGKSIKFLDLENVFVEKSFIPIWNKIKLQDKLINFAGIYSNYVIRGPDEMKLMFQRAIFLCLKPKKKKKQRNFGHVVLSLPDKVDMPRQDFDVFAKKQKIKMVDKDLMNGILQRFAGKNKSINAVALKECFMKYYPDTVLPPPKKKGKKKKDKKKGAVKSQPESEFESEEEEEDMAETNQENPEQVKGQAETEAGAGIQAAEQAESKRQSLSAEGEHAQTEAPASNEAASENVEAAPAAENESPENQVRSSRPSESAQGGGNPQT